MTSLFVNVIVVVLVLVGAAEPNKNKRFNLI